jgi:hypothetical protein
VHFGSGGVVAAARSGALSLTLCKLLRTGNHCASASGDPDALGRRSEGIAGAGAAVSGGIDRADVGSVYGSLEGEDAAGVLASKSAGHMTLHKVGAVELHAILASQHPLHSCDGSGSLACEHLHPVAS